MTERFDHYHIDIDRRISAALWRILTEQFEVVVIRRRHSEDGVEVNLWLSIREEKERADDE